MTFSEKLENDVILRDLTKHMYDRHKQWFEDSVDLIVRAGYSEIIAITIVSSEILERACTVMAASSRDTEEYLDIMRKMIARKKKRYERG